VLHDVNKAANQVLKYQIEEIKKVENPYPKLLQSRLESIAWVIWEDCRQKILKALEEK
jgi:hypothetical protein